MVTASRSRETHEQAVHRLAAKAREQGVRLKQDPRDGRYYASSVSQPGTWHYVTGFSCTCRGFVAHQRCMHHSALLAAFGWLPPLDPAPDAARVATPAEPARCPACDGVGEVPTGHAAMFGVAWAPCRDCAGTGKPQPLAA